MNQHSHKELITKAIANVCHLGPFYDKYWIACFEAVANIPGIDRTFRRIAYVKDPEQALDYLAEVRYILVFRGLDFQINVEPLGSCGPDILISKEDHSSFVEITRFRKIYPGPSEIIFEKYGDSERDTKKARDKIQSKFHQVASCASIIALWNDDGDLDYIEAQWAVDDLVSDMKNGHVSIPRGLWGIVYSSGWVDFTNDKQTYFFSMGKLEQHQFDWKHAVENSFINDLISNVVTVF